MRPRGDGKLQSGADAAQVPAPAARAARRGLAVATRRRHRRTGGPGETKLEVDRRRTRDRLTRLERELKKLAAQRQNRRQRRGAPRGPGPVHRRLYECGQEHAAASPDAHRGARRRPDVRDPRPHFAAPAVPARKRGNHHDTVGFIRDLPPDLVTAFRATLEELADASLLLHVVDAAASDCERRIEAVRGVLQDIGMQAPELLVFNQVDRMGDGGGRCDGAPARRRRGVRTPPHRPAKAADAGRRDALGRRRGSSELLALTFESATELPTSMRSEAMEHGWPVDHRRRLSAGGAVRPRRHAAPARRTGPPDRHRLRTFVRNVALLTRD